MIRCHRTTHTHHYQFTKFNTFHYCSYFFSKNFHKCSGLKQWNLLSHSSGSQVWAQCGSADFLLLVSWSLNHGAGKVAFLREVLG